MAAPWRSLVPYEIAVPGPSRCAVHDGGASAVTVCRTRWRSFGVTWHRTRWRRPGSHFRFPVQHGGAFFVSGCRTSWGPPSESRDDKQRWRLSGTAGVFRFVALVACVPRVPCGGDGIPVRVQRAASREIVLSHGVGVGILIRQVA